MEAMCLNRIPTPLNMRAMKGPPGRFRMIHLFGSVDSCGELYISCSEILILAKMLSIENPIASTVGWQRQGFLCSSRFL